MLLARMRRTRKDEGGTAELPYLVQALELARIHRGHENTRKSHGPIHPIVDRLGLPQVVERRRARQAPSSLDDGRPVVRLGQRLAVVIRGCRAFDGRISEGLRAARGT